MAMIIDYVGLKIYLEKLQHEDFKNGLIETVHKSFWKLFKWILENTRYLYKEILKWL